MILQREQSTINVLDSDLFLLDKLPMTKARTTRADKSPSGRTRAQHEEEQESDDCSSQGNLSWNTTPSPPTDEEDDYWQGQQSSQEEARSPMIFSSIPTRLNSLKLSRRKMEDTRSQEAQHSEATGRLCVLQPGPCDVICAKGHIARKHLGNRRFREQIQDKIDLYSKAGSKRQKSKIVSSIVGCVHDKGGCFIREHKMNKGEWVEVSDAIARDKVGQAFRDSLHIKYRSSTKAKRRRLKEQQEKEEKITLDEITPVLLAPMTMVSTAVQQHTPTVANNGMNLDIPMNQAIHDAEPGKITFPQADSMETQYNHEEVVATSKLEEAVWCSGPILERNHQTLTALEALGQHSPMISPEEEQKLILSILDSANNDMLNMIQTDPLLQRTVYDIHTAQPIPMTIDDTGMQ